MFGSWKSKVVMKKVPEYMVFLRQLSSSPDSHKPTSLLNSSSKEKGDVGSMQMAINGTLESSF